MIPTKKFHCNCEKSKCQKKYCECFANNEVCDVKCDCRSCKNCTKDAIEKIISNNLPSNCPHLIENDLFITNHESNNPDIETQKSNSDLALNDYTNNSKILYLILNINLDYKNYQENDNSKTQNNDMRELILNNEKRAVKALNAQTTNKKLISCTCTKSNCQKNYCDCFKYGLYCSENCRCIECKNSKALDVKIKPDKFCMEFVRVHINNDDMKVKEGKHLFSMVFNSSQMNKSFNKEALFSKNTFKKVNEDLSRNTSNTNFGYEESFINSDFCNQAKSDNNFQESKKATYRELNNSSFNQNQNEGDGSDKAKEYNNDNDASCQKNKKVKTEIVTLASDFKNRDSTVDSEKKQLSMDLPKALLFNSLSQVDKSSDLIENVDNADNSFLSKKRENTVLNANTNRSSISKSSTNDSSRNDLNLSGYCSENALTNVIKVESNNNFPDEYNNSVIKAKDSKTASKKIKFSSKKSKLRLLKYVNPTN